MKNQNTIGGCMYLLVQLSRCSLHLSSNGGFAYNMTTFIDKYYTPMYYNPHAKHGGF